jgi:hypothetical protein
MWGISGLAENQLAAQEGLCCKEKARKKVSKKVTHTHTHTHIYIYIYIYIYIFDTNSIEDVSYRPIRCVACQVVADISKEHVAFIFTEGNAILRNVETTCQRHAPQPTRHRSAINKCREMKMLRSRLLWTVGLLGCWALLGSREILHNCLRCGTASELEQHLSVQSTQTDITSPVWIHFIASCKEHTWHTIT